MEPTLVNGDIVLLTKTTNFDRGELCGFSWNNKLLIKRVIGIPGDWIEIDTDGTVYLNGDRLDEPYAAQLSMGECNLEFPFQVPQEQYFMLGDMRESSIDCRYPPFFLKSDGKKATSHFPPTVCPIWLRRGADFKGLTESVVQNQS